MKKSFSMISLGCPRNLVDSECIISDFKKRGYVYQEDADGVNTVIINTCAFIEDAKKESIDIILKAIDAKKSGAVKKVIVTGCLPERYPVELKKELKDIDEFRGVVDFGEALIGEDSRRLTPRHYAYLKISEGCGNRCTYCIIPSIKGPYRSRSIESITKEAKSLIQKGSRELILVGQDTSLYGIDLYGKKKLAELLKNLNKISGENWIRLLYCHPANLDRDVIKIIRDCGNICKYIDLPVEHISDKILRKMGRKTRKSDIISLIEYIRKVIPDVALRSSVIVGFPGETEKDFKETMSFVRETGFERLGLFRYSREEGTPAYRFKGQVPEEEKERRFNEIMSLQQVMSRGINENFKGRVLKVLIEEKEEEYYIARTEYDAPEVDGLVYVYPRREKISSAGNGKKLKIGNFYNVRITDTYEYDLVGDLL